ncbi:MAG: type IV toxin-antitoxin system AbiEi family antitoxin domain-containing protein [Candidatus Saganbacteria bacterium]|nr:type IV toxin-antitoxin system AbiEi family antitoxin domain-containing protein [Candidatus Saganbacteria bacterium]
MKWNKFEREIRKKNIKLFTTLDIQRFLGRSPIAVRFLVHRLKKQGEIQRVKRGLYKLTGEPVSELYLANKLYEPSYISLELALSYHRVIPETVYEITSITPKTTRRFETQGKVFSYRRLKQAAFTGYTTAKQRGMSFLIADPEKAFVDLNYFRMLDGLKPVSRFDKGRIDPAKALRYAALFGNSRLTGIIKTTLQ